MAISLNSRSIWQITLRSDIQITQETIRGFDWKLPQHSQTDPLYWKISSHNTAWSALQKHVWDYHILVASWIGGIKKMSTGSHGSFVLTSFTVSFIFLTLDTRFACSQAKTRASRKRWRHDNHVINLLEFSANSNAKWLVIYAFSNFAGLVVWTGLRLYLTICTVHRVSTMDGIKSSVTTLLNTIWKNYARNPRKENASCFLRR